MKKLFLTALLAAQGLFATQAKAQEQTRWEKDLAEGKVSAVFDVASWRFGDNQGNFNPGVGGEWRLRDYFHVGAGIFRSNQTVYHYNAKDRRHPCIYAAAGFEDDGQSRIGGGAEIGVSTVPGGHVFAVPYVRLGSRDDLLNVKINVIPPGPKSPLTIGFQLRYNLGDPTYLGEPRWPRWRR